MAGTYTNLLYHLVFSTKHRVPYINDPQFTSDLHAYLGGAVRGHGGKALGIGGMPDHVHLLVHLTPDAKLKDFMRDIKSGTSRWVHQTYPAHPDRSKFAWQEGYGAFTVSESSKASVLAYIANQPEHHKKSCFQAEFRRMLTKHKISYDENTIWL